MKGVVAKFVIDPQHYRNRARKLECLKSCGIISPVQFSDWATNSIHNQTSDTIYEYNCHDHLFYVLLNKASLEDLSYSSGTTIG